MGTKNRAGEIPETPDEKARYKQGRQERGKNLFASKNKRINYQGKQMIKALADILFKIVEIIGMIVLCIVCSFIIGFSCGATWILAQYWMQIK